MQVPDKALHGTNRTAAAKLSTVMCGWQKARPEAHRCFIPSYFTPTFTFKRIRQYPQKIKRAPKKTKLLCLSRVNPAASKQKALQRLSPESHLMTSFKYFFHQTEELH